MKDIRFFCERCGTEVRSKDKICQTCGSFFVQVRCPLCNFQAEANKFTHGCPSCGYSGEGFKSAKNLPDGMVEIDFPGHPVFESHSSGIKNQVKGQKSGSPLPVVLGMSVLAFIALVWYYITVIRGGL
jgi:hypothetical protein